MAGHYPPCDKEKSYGNKCGEEVTTGAYDDRRVTDIVRREIERERTEIAYRSDGSLLLSGGSWSFNGMYS